MDKTKETIRKLLALSLSDNEHEAKLATNKAIELMNKHGISETDLQDNPFITNKFDTTFYKIPNWLAELWCQLGYVSGTIIVYANGKKSIDRKANVRIAGRKADVEIARYLGDVLSYEINKKIDSAKPLFKYKPRTAFNSYKEGLAVGVVWKIKEAQKTFFEHNKTQSNALVPIDTRTKEAREWYFSLEKVTQVKSKDKHNDVYFNNGVSDAKKISVNKAMNGGRATNLLEFKAS